MCLKLIPSLKIHTAAGFWVSFIYNAQLAFDRPSNNLDPELQPYAVAQPPAYFSAVEIGYLMLRLRSLSIIFPLSRTWCSR